MRKNHISQILALSFLLTAILAVPVYANDNAVIRAILNKIGRKDDDVEDVAKFNSMGRAIQLNLNKRGLSGVAITELPAEVFQLTQLKGLLLKGNTLKSIPHEIGQLTELVELNLADNNDLGTLPPAIGDLQNLQKLDARYCGLTTLPASFGNLKRLENLQLWGNGFTELPFCVLDMTSLKELYLNHNKLTSLPLDIIKLPITYIDTHMNILCDLPAEVDAWLVQRDRQYKDHQYCDNVKHF